MWQYSKDNADRERGPNSFVSPEPARCDAALLVEAPCCVAETLLVTARGTTRHLDAFVDAHWQNMGEANSTQTSTSQAYEVEERKTDNIRLHGERTRDDGLNRVRCIGERVPRSNGDSLHILK